MVVTRLKFRTPMNTREAMNIREYKITKYFVKQNAMIIVAYTKPIPMSQCFYVPYTSGICY